MSFGGHPQQKCWKEAKSNSNCSATSCRASILLFLVHLGTDLTVSHALMSSETGTPLAFGPPEAQKQASVM